MNRSTLGLIILTLAAAPVAAPAQTAPAPATAPKGDAAKGQALFGEYLCYACHGSRGSNGNGGPVAGSTMFPYAAFLNQVRKPRRQMPAYPEAALPDQAVADIYAYLKTMPPSPAVKDIPLLNR